MWLFVCMGHREGDNIGLLSGGQWKKVIIRWEGTGVMDH